MHSLIHDPIAVARPDPTRQHTAAAKPIAGNVLTVSYEILMEIALKAVLNLVANVA